MALAELLDSLRTKRRTAERSKHAVYLDAVRSLASGQELDADQVAGIMAAADRTETDLEADVQIMVRRLAAAETLRRHEASKEAYEVACRELVDAQERLDEAIARLQPAVDQAVNRRAARELDILQTANGEEILLTTVLDPDLMRRETELVAERREILEKLKPLQEDRQAFAAWESAQGYKNIDLQKRLAEAVGDVGRRYSRDRLDAGETRQTDLTSRVRQIDAASRPMQRRLDEISSELADIHGQKLQP